MKITIHRGINQIGGCITEIATNNSRIIIDLGQNLPDGDGIVNDNFANKEEIARITKEIDAIFYTHYHGDHFGLFHLVPDRIPQYIGRIAKKVALCKHQRLSLLEERKEISEIEIAKIELMKSFEPDQVIQIGDIKVTPYFVSHSAYDSYMFLIEAEGKLILHTGDFRDHGYLGRGLLPTIKKRILTQGNIDFLITEGTMLSRPAEKVRHEGELQIELSGIMRKYQNVFVLCSSTDMERLSTIYSANKQCKTKPFICDDFQEKILKIFSESAGEKSSLFKFDKPYIFFKGNEKLLNWIQDKGFCMLVRATDKFNDYIEYLLPKLDMKKTVFIYSMWSEYVNPASKHANKKYIDLLNKFSCVKHVHTSGHASVECLASVCNLANPSLGIIPIHSDNSSDYRNLLISEELKERIITESREIEGINIKI